MSKITYRKSLLLVSTLTSFLLPIGITQITTLATELNKNKVINYNYQQSKSSTSDGLCGLFCRQDEDNGSRAPFCSIWPNNNAANLLTTNQVRLFVWQAAENVKLQRIEIIDFVTESVIWSHNVTETEQQKQMVNYTGSVLEPGDYEYKITYEQSLNGETTSFSESIDFEVAQTNDIVTISTNNQATNPEKKAREIAEKLTNKGMVADALQVVFAVDNPSPEWNNQLQEVRLNFCPPS